MPAQQVKLASPLRGVNRALARSQQPELTCWDAQNVLPFDRYGRLRAAQRPGFSRVWASAIGSGTQSVQTLLQTTLALDPATITPNVTLLNETFTYANGNLQTVSSGVWVTSNPPSAFNMGGATTATLFPIVSNQIVNTATAAQAARYTPALTLGSAYIIQADVKFSAISTNSVFAIQIRGDVANLSTSGISCRVETQASNPQLRLTTSNGTVIGAPVNIAGVISAGTTFTVQVQVNGDVIKMAINGIVYLTISDSTSNTFSAIGMETNSNSAVTTTIDNYNVYTGQQLATYRQTNIVAISGGSVYEGDINTQGLVTTGGTSVLKDTGSPGATFFSGFVYMVDGVNHAKQLNLTTRTTSDLVPTAGSETTTTLGRYQIATTYRGRLVLAADRLNPQNFIMSRSGTPTDFDYSQTDPAAAFAGNASTTGRIGEPITAMIPFSDDILLIGGDHNLWVIRGDPADGGSIDLVSDSIGILGPNAWTKAPDGTVYFVGTGGLFRITAGAETPENISLASYPQFFTNINRGTQQVTAVWDRDRFGCWIFVTPVNTGAATHVFYDKRAEGFWPLVFPNSLGPLSAIMYDGDGPTDRTLIGGSRDGFLLRPNDLVRADETGGAGTAISSYITLGPLLLSDNEAVLTGATFDFGELSVADSVSPDRWNSNIVVQAGKTAYDVTEGVPTGTATVGWGRDRRTKTLRQRLRGRYFSIKVTNSGINNYFSLDDAMIEFSPAGRGRRQR